MMTSDYIDLVWGEFPGIPDVIGGDAELDLILASVLGIFNLCFSIFGATSVIKSRSTKDYDMLLSCVVTTGCVNMLVAYLRRNSTDDSWLGWAFTVTLMLDAVLNATTAFRIVRAYPLDAYTLPQYMPVVRTDLEVSEYVWIARPDLKEKSCARGVGGIDKSILSHPA
ncbi:hypothetical protein DFH07DRAFT_173240 [Mycena maculata]|uniref:Uncharacterized protein n=1 Tax=Mycena maculata TaxID=230809 RepID=A0AAD7HXE6_9AGAR|nr:hypothetical protein DFH07DRAFT_173240 [Mycena maculata]